MKLGPILLVVSLAACTSTPDITINSLCEPADAVRRLTAYYEPVSIQSAETGERLETDWVERETEDLTGWILPHPRLERHRLTLEVAPHELGGSWVRAWIRQEIRQARGSLGLRWQPIEVPIQRSVAIAQEIESVLDEKAEKEERP